MFENIELFSSLSKNAISSLEMFCQERKIASWEILFHKWEESTSMYIVKSWKLQAYDGDKVLWYIKSWEFVWEMALFDEPKVRSASVKAVEDTELIILLSFSIDQLSRSHPEIVSEIKKVIEERKRQNKLNLN